MSAADRWRAGLALWAIPDRILAAAPTDPHAFSVRRFSELADTAAGGAPTPTHRRAAERLPRGGSVLDVGCGGGAGSLPLSDRADLLVGVDRGAGMLEAFANAAADADVTARTVRGDWPDVAGDTPVADVVVCLHVVYNVADLVGFTRALASHARRRVVLELPERHPLDWLRPYWQGVHGIERPHEPTADDALEVFDDLGLAPHHERWQRPHSLHGSAAATKVDFVCRRLAVGDDRRGDVERLVARHGVPATRSVVTVWWDTPATGVRAGG